MRVYDLELNVTEQGDILIQQTHHGRGDPESILISPDQVDWLVLALQKIRRELTEESN